MKALMMVVAVMLTGCNAYWDPMIGTAPCEARCGGGCCLGDPKRVETICVGDGQQDDSACGGGGRECSQCGTYINDKGEQHTTICAFNSTYGEGMCVSK